MFDKFIGLLWGSSNKHEEEEDDDFFLKIHNNPLQLLTLIKQTIEQVYHQNDQFPLQYTSPLLQQGNQQFILQLETHIVITNAKKYPNIKYYELLSQEIVMEQGYIVCLIKLWLCYVENKIKKSSKDSLTLFREEIYYFKKVITTLFARIYHPPQHLHSQPYFRQSSCKFKIKLISQLTEFHQYKTIKSTIINKSKKGIVGQFSNSQVTLTGLQLQQLIKFKQIPAPFNHTISIILNFYREHRLPKQLHLLVQAVSSAKKEIAQYRQFFNLGNSVVGSDQVMPILNFICEKTEKNIYANTQLLKCWLGDKRVYTDAQARGMLQLINPQADYCLNLIESVSSIYCHASLMIN